MSNYKRYKINHNIKYPELRVILGSGENLGVVSTSDALRKAQELDMDLVVITEGTNPPVAKILDFNKFLYQENKKAAESKSKSKKSKVKEFKIGPMIDEYCIKMRADRAKEFIEDGNLVKVTVLLRGRQQAYPQVGFDKIRKFIDMTAEFARPESEIKQTGGQIFVTLIKR